MFKQIFVVIYKIKNQQNIKVKKEGVMKGIKSYVLVEMAELMKERQELKTKHARFTKLLKSSDENSKSFIDISKELSKLEGRIELINELLKD